MCHARKNKVMYPTEWMPSGSIPHLKKRAQLLEMLRAFFKDRGVMEVETPLMCHTSVTDPMIESVPVLFRELSKKDHESQRYYLQTSPEYAMKRLLSAGSGCIFQLSKAFRQGEVGRYHNPEFSMLEWYRIGFDHHALMDEMDALLMCLLNVPPADRISYQALFEMKIGIDPHTVTLSQCESIASHLQLDIASTMTTVDEWLNIFMSHEIEPNLGHDHPYFIYDFPVSMSALSRIVPGNPSTASRFEVYFKGIELANGFHELSDAKEQRKRFEGNAAARKALGLVHMPIDEYFLASLAHGLPDCAGVALGFDRLVMLALGLDHIQSVLSFDFSRV